MKFKNKQKLNFGRYNKAIDYTKLPDPHRKKLKQNLDHGDNHKLARFAPECREEIAV